MVMKYVFDLKAITDTEAVCQPYKKKKKKPKSKPNQTNQPTNQSKNQTQQKKLS